MDRNELKIMLESMIGVPPNAVVFNMLRMQLPGVTDDEIEAALNELHDEGKIQLVNGWIAGISEQARRIKHALDNMTADDYAWLTGTGRFAQ